MYTPSTHSSSPADTTDVPIYESLVREFGDVPTDARQIAEATLEKSHRTLDFGLARPSAS